jgi:hypothetical protein
MVSTKKISMGTNTSSILIIIQAIVIALTYLLSQNLVITGTVAISMVIMILTFLLKTQTVVVQPATKTKAAVLSKKTQLAISQGAILLVVQLVITVLTFWLNAGLEVSATVITSMVLTALVFILKSQNVEVPVIEPTSEPTLKPV